MVVEAMATLDEGCMNFNFTSILNSDCPTKKCCVQQTPYHVYEASVFECWQLRLHH